jgi:ATP-dependent helicase/nuclease subunit B
MPGGATGIRTRPTVCNITSAVPFVDALAAGILDRYGADPAALPEIRVLLPTRRACRALGEAFLRATGGAPMLLPHMIPIGDVDEDEIALLAFDEPAFEGALDLPPAMPPLRRQLLLARLIVAADPRGMSPAHAALLADGLGRLIDEVRTERLDFSRLEKLVPERFAEHWQQTLSFLRIVTEHWPAILEAEGCMDSAERRNRMIDAQVALWREAPPTMPVIAAGSTGSIPATAELLACVAYLPEGCVVLPGLDRTLDAASTDAVGPGHPQFGMLRLLDRLGLAIADVADWSAAAGAPSPRTAVVNAALRPPATSDRIGIPDGLVDAFADVRRIACPGPQQEALAVALLLRESLETPGRTAALVTPDRRLARRVAAELRRWEIDVDDSGGTPLAETVPGVFLRLTGEAVAADAAPLPLLAALKHPLAAGGLDPAAFRDLVRDAERAVLRGPRPAPGFAGLRRALETAGAEPALVRWAAALEEAARPFALLMRRGRVPADDLLEAHVAFAETLAASDAETGVVRMWAGEAGEAAAGLVNELRDAALMLPPIAGHEWTALLDALMRGAVVRPAYGRHPRLSIWGLLEARLQQADLVVLSGLNEGTWPPEPAVDPWMSRPMRADFGLAPPERRVGLTAHDFVQAFAARDVALTRSTRIDGSPTVPARWLTRLETLLSASDGGRAVLDRWSADERGMLDWTARIDLRLPPVIPQAPAPCPPVAARPLRLSVTEIERLVRDPYEIYAKRVLGLAALPRIDEDPGAADRGSIIHHAVDRFLAEIGRDLPPDALDRLLAFGAEAFAPFIDRPGVRAFWWPRFERVARWVIEREAERAPTIEARFTEKSGELVLADRVRPFRLVARADRIDLRTDGGYAIIDYKTGTVPSKRDVAAGLSPQLSLEAAMIARGAFPGVAPGPVYELAYWRLSGGDPPGEIKSAGDDPGALATEALEGLRRLLDHYADPDAVYLTRPDPEAAPRYSDYDHLERVQEWAAATGGVE